MAIVFVIGVIVGIAFGAIIAFSLFRTIREDNKKEQSELPKPPVNRPVVKPTVSTKKNKPARKAKQEDEPADEENNSSQDAIDALASLGFKKDKAKSIVLKITNGNPSMPIDEIIRKALGSK